MLKLPMVLAFTAMTAFFWGIYGIVLHKGTSLMELKEKTFQGELGVSLRAFVGVGLAYFLIAVLVPVALLNRKRETGYWSLSGTIMSLFAGSVGALGAFGVAMALAFKAQAIFVMPIVFGGAPVVNTLLTSYLNKSFQQIKPLFLVGMAMVAVGMIGVFINKPQAAAHAKAGASSSADVKDRSDQTDQTDQTDRTTAAERKTINWLAVGLSIAMAVLCWGAYGPFLHIGQAKMGGSRLRPFCCVGIAYFFIAVMVPVVLIESMSMHSSSGYAIWGMTWSVLAGTCGALGALGIILAFTYGGKPIFVMPLVFGFAPVINTLTSIVEKGKFESLNAMFGGSLLLGILGAVTVLLNAPKAAPHGKPSATPSQNDSTQTSSSPFERESNL
jgi:MFS family permease